MFKVYETELAGRKLTIETGKMAGLANGNVLVRYGDTCVMVNVTASKEPKDGIDFFPLSVDYEEKLYSVGKIPGSYTKREGKPSDKAILTSRAIDRPLRPLFPKDFRNDVVVVATVLSVDQDNSPEVAAMIGASAALSISDIPFGGPTAAVNVGYVDGEIIINPTVEQRGPNINLKIQHKRYSNQKEKEFFFTKIKTKKKTELCKNYELYHDCYYKDECCFAHGIDELRENINFSSYKTKMCKSFHYNNYCNFGIRCSYRHNIK